jgi:hypothetical protein
VRADEGDVRLFDTVSAPDGTLLVFGLLPAVTGAALPASAPTAETSGWEVIDGPAELAFDLHSRMVERYFASEIPQLG